jgi:hypothetical protein
LLLALLDRAKNQAAFEAELVAPASRDYVETALDAAEADRLAGHTYSLGEIRQRSFFRLKALHG